MKKPKLILMEPKNEKERPKLDQVYCEVCGVVVRDTDARLCLSWPEQWPPVFFHSWRCLAFFGGLRRAEEQEDRD